MALDVPEVFGLLGHNGAGKTQLGHIKVEWTRMKQREREKGREKGREGAQMF